MGGIIAILKLKIFVYNKIMDTVEKVKALVNKLLNDENSGHGMDHVNRVLELSLKFAEGQPANIEVVSLIALLHDVDDYKLFGSENAENLTNAKTIMNDCGVDDDVKKQVIEAIETIGYSKRLKGITPTTIEAKIVSDADMCDAMGVSGILRSYQYNVSHGNSFFDRNIFPMTDVSAEKYKARNNGTSVTHMFEKPLKLRKMMLTEPGQKEAMKRHDFMVKFLYQFFDEENAPEWVEYLDNYLKNES